MIGPGGVSASAIPASVRPGTWENDFLPEESLLTGFSGIQSVFDIYIVYSFYGLHHS
jgi:hypothetical protein